MAVGCDKGRSSPPFPPSDKTMTARQEPNPSGVMASSPTFGSLRCIVGVYCLLFIGVPLPPSLLGTWRMNNIVAKTGRGQWRYEPALYLRQKRGSCSCIVWTGRAADSCNKRPHDTFQTSDLIRGCHLARAFVCFTGKTVKEWRERRRDHSEELVSHSLWLGCVCQPGNYMRLILGNCFKMSLGFGLVWLYLEVKNENGKLSPPLHMHFTTESLLYRTAYSQHWPTATSRAVEQQLKTQHISHFLAYG